jgi:hypothetical protein
MLAAAGPTGGREPRAMVIEARRIPSIAQKCAGMAQIGLGRGKGNPEIAHC